MTLIITFLKVVNYMLNKTNFHYPAMLRVTGKNCVIIGGGTVAARKLSTLLDAGAKVTVVAPLFCDEVQKARLKAGMHAHQGLLQTGISAECICGYCRHR